jgi:hypothetical protein
MNGDSANRRPAGKSGSHPTEVCIPLVRTRMEESNQLARLRICSSDVRTLMPIAVEAGESEVFKYSQPPVLACNDVINVKG